MFLDLPPKMQNPFLDSDLDFSKKTHPKFCRLTAEREREKILETPRVSHFVIIVALCIPVPNCYNACRTL